MKKTNVYSDLCGRIQDDTGQVARRASSAPAHQARTERRALARHLTRAIPRPVSQVTKRLGWRTAVLIALTVSTVLTVHALSPALRLPIIVTVLTLLAFAQLTTRGSYVDADSRRACTPTPTAARPAPRTDTPSLRAIGGSHAVARQPEPPTVEVISVRTDK